MVMRRLSQMLVVSATAFAAVTSAQARHVPPPLPDVISPDMATRSARPTLSPNHNEPATVVASASSSKKNRESDHSSGPASVETSWVYYTVKGGDTLSAIGRRYKASTAELIRWNRLKDAGRIRIGQRLKVRAVTRTRSSSTSPAGIKSSGAATVAQPVRQDLRPTDIDAPNPAATHRTGNQQAIAYLRTPTNERSTARESGSRRAVSIGSPNRGKILHAVQIHSKTGSHVVRTPDQAWATSHTQESLQRAFAGFRQRSRYRHELVVQAISLRNGGRFRPHKSHQSGRDVDIRLPVASGVSASTIPESASQVDWTATWHLIEAMLATGEVEYIFLDYRRQRALSRAALRLGVPRSRVAALLQWPSRSSKTEAFVRHSPGHTSHLHVRFRCSSDEKMCLTY
jgi:LysM repeat protein